MVISDAHILRLSPKEKDYKRFFGEGLYILVRRDGKKYWRMKVRFGGKETSYSLGVYPKVSLAIALAAHKAAREMLREGLNPVIVRREAAMLKANQAQKKLFRCELSSDGRLTLETDRQRIALSPSQTKVVQHLLLSSDEAKGDTQK